LLKICDFGLARVANPGKETKTKITNKKIKINILKVKTGINF